MKIRIDTELCQGHGMCWLACPELFQLSDEDGHAYLLADEVPADLHENVRQAERGCPERAIRLVEE